MPRSLGSRGAGNFNLKGKKSHVASCKCCIVWNFREEYEGRAANAEMRTATVADGHPEYTLEAIHETGFDDGLPDTRQFDEHDRGRWSVFTQKPGEIGIISTDFKHDVVLYVNGDFACDESKMEYAQLIANRLNRE